MTDHLIHLMTSSLLYLWDIVIVIVIYFKLHNFTFIPYSHLSLKSRFSIYSFYLFFIQNKSLRVYGARNLYTILVRVLQKLYHVIELFLINNLVSVISFMGMTSSGFSIRVFIYNKD